MIKHTTEELKEMTYTDIVELLENQYKAGAQHALNKIDKKFCASDLRGRDMVGEVEDEMELNE